MDQAGLIDQEFKETRIYGCRYLMVDLTMILWGLIERRGVDNVRGAVRPE
jgi:hypothetical protein